MSTFPRVLQGFDTGLHLQQLRPDAFGVPRRHQICTLAEFYDWLLRLATVRLCARFKDEEKILVPLPEHLKTKYSKHISDADVRRMLAAGDPDLEVIAFWSTIHLPETIGGSVAIRKPLSSIIPLIHGLGLGAQKGVKERTIEGYVHALNSDARSYVSLSHEDTQLLIAILSPCHAMFVA